MSHCIRLESIISLKFIIRIIYIYIEQTFYDVTKNKYIQVLRRGLIAQCTSIYTRKYIHMCHSKTMCSIKLNTCTFPMLLNLFENVNNANKSQIILIVQYQLYKDQNIIRY